MVRMKATVWTLLWALCLAPPQVAVIAAERPPGFIDADQAFARKPIEERAHEQLMLTATGYWPAMPNGEFGPRMFEAIRRFQSENGFVPTGILDRAQTMRLTAMSDATFALWGFRRTKHPSRSLAIWIPYGLGLTVERNAFGLHITDPERRVLIDFTTVPRVAVADNFDALLSSLAQQRATIYYKIIKDAWFVISASTPDGVDHYMRYYQDGDHVTGFTASWNNANGDVHGERIATLMSASLWAATIGPFNIEPPVAPHIEAPTPDQVVALPGPAPAAPTQVPSTPPPEPPQKDKPTFQSGTGFFVSQDGALLTNAHVVSDCTDVHVKTADGMVSTASVKRLDATNDLALLQANGKPTRSVSFRASARLGEAVEAFGFPHSDMLSSAGNFTLGSITALSGMGDDSRYYQVSAPVQAGNSGGPLLDASGNVVGIITAKLNALKMALQDGDLVQNVNFAVKATLITTFLESSNVPVQTGALAPKALDPPDIADAARMVSALVVCRSTAAAAR